MFWSEQDRTVCGLAGGFLDGDFERALALRERHGEELALLAGDEQASDPKVVDPVTHVAPQSRLVEREVALAERRIGGGKNAAHMRAGIVLCLVLAVFHRRSLASVRG